MDGSIDLDTDTIKVMLVTSSYTPDQDAHDFRDDVSDEVSGTGYSASGVALANKAVTADNTDNESVVDADDVAWSSSTITARGAVLYKSRGGAASDDELICYIELGWDKVSYNGTFELQFNVEDILNLNLALWQSWQSSRRGLPPLP